MIHPAQGEPGCAHYFSESEFIKGKPKLGTFVRENPGGVPVTRFERIQHSIRNNACLPLTSLLTLSKKEFDDPTNSRSHINIAHAWSFVHFLLHSKKAPKGKELLVTLFMSMRGGATPESAYASTFGTMDMNKLEAAWREYVLGL